GAGSHPTRFADQKGPLWDWLQAQRHHNFIRRPGGLTRESDRPMPPASSPSGVSRHGQLWNPQAREGTELAQASPALRAPLCPHEFQLAQPGRALVRPLGSKGDPAGRVPKRRGTEGVHRRIPHGVEQGSETVRVDRDGRIHPGETLPLPPDAGEDPACLHQSRSRKPKKKLSIYFVDSTL